MSPLEQVALLYRSLTLNLPKTSLWGHARENPVSAARFGWFHMVPICPHWSRRCWQVLIFGPAPCWGGALS